MLVAGQLNRTRRFWRQQTEAQQSSGYTKIFIYAINMMVDKFYKITLMMPGWIRVGSGLDPGWIRVGTRNGPADGFSVIVSVLVKCFLSGLDVRKASALQDFGPSRTDQNQSCPDPPAAGQASRNPSRSSDGNGCPQAALVSMVTSRRRVLFGWFLQKCSSRSCRFCLDLDPF